MYRWDALEDRKGSRRWLVSCSTAVFDGPGTHVRRRAGREAKLKFLVLIPKTG